MGRKRHTPEQIIRRLQETKVPPERRRSHSLASLSDWHKIW